MFLPNQTHPQVSKIEAVYEVKKFQVVKSTTDPATKEVWSCFKMCNCIPLWNNKQEMIFFIQYQPMWLLPNLSRWPHSKCNLGHSWFLSTGSIEIQIQHLQTILFYQLFWTFSQQYALGPTCAQTRSDRRCTQSCIGLMVSIINLYQYG